MRACLPLHFPQPGVRPVAHRLRDNAPIAVVKLRLCQRQRRAEILGGSFFDEVPPADAYILQGIIHDWNDTDAVAILKNCRRSISAGGKLLISTSMLKSSGEPDRGNFMDIYMMLYGGRERTEDEFRAILADSGFSLKRVIPTSLPAFVLESEPA